MDEYNYGSFMNTSNGGFISSEDEDLSYKSSPEIVHYELNQEKHIIGDEFRSMYDIISDEISHLEFETLDEACTFYETYARSKGFVVRKDDVQRDSSNNIKMRQLVCNKAGLRDKIFFTMVDRKKPHKPITRTNYEAKFRVHLDYKSSKWIVTSFVEQHNHYLCPSKYVHLFPAYRALNDADKAQIDILHAQGVRTCHIMGYMVAQKGGYNKVGFTKKDLYNYLDRQKHVKIQDGDARAALSYLQGKGDNDPMLFCKYGVGTDGKLKHLFWADGASIVDFQCFGDVLAFDTTYKKNKYNCPLVIFSGCNHHSQTVIFGCALVSDETIETYQWVLKAFLEAMHNKHPISVVTDGDMSMRDAVKEVFPKSTHRLCAWHLHQNALENVKIPAFVEDFQKAMYANYTPEQFEEFWQNIVDEHDVGSNPWVLKTYQNKKLWATAYLRETFFGRIRTTSQCEAINSLIKSYVRKKTALVEFTHNFEQLLREYRNNEVIADFKTCFSEPVMTTSLKDIEREAAQIYTLELFKEVKKEIEIGCAFNVVGRTEIGDNLMLELSHYSNAYSLVEVEFDRSKSLFSCDCRLFESRGIPCRHIICVMKTERIRKFPQSLICERWTKRSKSDIVSSLPADEVDCDVLLTARFGALAAACNQLCRLAAKKTESFNEVRDEIVRLTQKIDSGGGKCNTRVSNGVTDPTIVKTKGAPKQNKFGTKRKRCSKCNYVGHTIRTCPKLRSRNEGGMDALISSDFTNADQGYHGRDKWQQENCNDQENVLKNVVAKSLDIHDFGMNDETIFGNEVVEVDYNDDVGNKSNEKCPLTDSGKVTKKPQIQSKNVGDKLNMGKNVNKKIKRTPLPSPKVFPATCNAKSNDLAPLMHPYGTPLQQSHDPLVPQMRPEVAGVDHNGGKKSFTSLLEEVIQGKSQSGNYDQYS